MTIQETHIYIKQELQKINSYAVENFLPEEIDLLLNKFTRKFVDSVVGRLKPNEPTYFQHNQRLIDQIHTLVIKNEYLPSIVDSKEPNLSYTILPANYKHLISDASELVVSTDKSTVDKTLYLYVLDFLVDKQPIADIQLEVNGDVVFDLSDYSDYYANGITDPDVLYQLVALIQDDVPSIYWERCAGEHYKNSFILLFDAATVVNVIMGGVTTPITAKTIPHKRYKDIVAERTIRKPNRIHSDVNLDFIRQHPFEKTTWESPISSMAEGKLYVYEDVDFKAKRISIDYIRNPIQVSLGIGSNSDLPQDAQDLIIEQTVVHLKGLIHDPSWEVAVKENQITNN